MKAAVGILFALFSLSVFSSPLQGTWVLDGERACLSGAPINDIFFDNFTSNYTLSIGREFMTVAMTVTGLPQINGGKACDMKMHYTFRAEKSEGRALSQLHRKFSYMDSDCANDQQMGPTSITLNYTAVEDQLILVDQVLDPGAQCAIGDAIITRLRRN